MNISMLIYTTALLFIACGGSLIAKQPRKYRLPRDIPNVKGIILQTKLFQRVKAYLEQRRKERLDMEIYEAISFLRNTIAINSNSVSGVDSMIEELAGHRGLLSPIYGQMLRMLRQNQKSEAIRCFSEGVGTEIAKDFARFLIQWDEIEPKELMETLLSHQRNIKEVRLTLQKKRDETMSDLIYLPVVLNLMLVFLNFIYVGYFLDQKEMLTMLL